MSFEMRGNQLRLGGRRIGWITTLISGERVFISPRTRKKHYMKIYEGFGLSKAVFDFLKKHDFTQIQLRIGKSETLISDVSAWEEHGIHSQFEPFEKQVFLPEKYMKRKVLTLAEIPERMFSKRRRY